MRPDARFKRLQFLPPDFSPGAGVFWVADSLDTASGSGPAPPGVVPHPSLTSALAACRNNCGDVIYVAPNYTESVGSATALTFNKADVHVIGLGHGPTMPRPIDARRSS